MSAAMDMSPDPLLHDAPSMLTAWDALAADAAEPNCFYAPEMLLPAIRHLTQEKDVLLLQAWEGEELIRSEEHTSELQSLMRIPYAVFCLKKKIFSLITFIYI